MVPTEIIDSILEKVDIVELISSKIPLRKAGRNFKAPCPFHSEKTPSFMVSQDKQIFHCFGCGEGGNAIGFLMKYDRLTFREALEALAEKAGVRLPAFSSSGDSQQNRLFDILYGLNEKARDFYKANLAGSDGAVAKRYLKERGVDDASIDLFHLGFSPAAWDGLIGYFQKNNVRDMKILERAGLVMQREKGNGYYDRFRNRVMFPIFNPGQKVIGFGARSLDNSHPKYMNSPETPVYNKGRHLYGLNFTKGFIKEKDFAIIVEGYLDLIIPFQYGVKNIVATLGTALTPDQIRLLGRFSKTAVIVFDPDTAGQEASLRGLDLLVSFEMNVRIATLPKGYDPDTFVRKHGKDAFLEIIKSSRDLFDYKMNLLMGKYNKDGVRGRAAIATLMLPTIARIPNEILKASFLKKLSDTLEIDETALKAELRKIKPDYSYVVSVQPPRRPDRKASGPEIFLLSLILDDRGVIDALEEKLGSGAVSRMTIGGVIDVLKKMKAENRETNAGRLMTHFDDEGVRTLIAEAAGLLDTICDRDKVFSDCVGKLKSEAIKSDLERLRMEMSAAEGSNDSGRLRSLMTQYNDLLKTIKG